MSRLRARLTYANVMATVALFIALSGSSYAAIKVTGKSVKDSSLTGRDVRNASLTTLDVKNRSLLAKDFKAGQLPAGARGADGATGATGSPGADGATGSALLTGAATGLPSISSPGSFFHRAAVNDAGPIGDTDEVATLLPNRTLTARNLSAGIFVDLPTGGSVTIAFRESPPGVFNDTGGESLACTITGTDGSNDKACTAPGSINLAPGAVIFVRIILSSNGTLINPTTAYWGLTIEPS